MMMQITIRQLRSMINVIMEEKGRDEFYREKLLQWAQSSNSVDDKRLLSVGLIPIPRGDGDHHGMGFVGSGAYSTAHEVLWHNKRAIAKITSKEEADSYAKWQKAREAAPDIVKRHMVNILEIGEIPSERKQTAISKRLKSPTHPFWYIVVEPLIPMSRAMASFFDSYELDENASYQRIVAFLESDDLQDLWEGCVANLPRNAAAKAFNLFVTKIKEIVRSNPPKAYSDADESIWDIDQVIKQITKERDKITGTMVDMIKDLGGQNFDERNLQYFFVEFDRALTKNVVAPIPMEFGERDVDVEKIKQHPELRSFHVALNWLSQKMGIEWGDMHGDNVMARPGEKDVLVISDPGLFFGL
jgi:hypothetical protein